ncbi:MAG: hypothetical protein H6832_02965 [Planctomycetes bacterium]|nr:hypothetical protein [Planctomycetota bacterium]MCB9917343.1 hypothetical protein [Planctomycetota bacterium]
MSELKEERLRSKRDTFLVCAALCLTMAACKAPTGVRGAMRGHYTLSGSEPGAARDVVCDAMATPGKEGARSGPWR